MNNLKNIEPGVPIKLYRGLILLKGEEIDLNEAGVCWSFNKNIAKLWIEGIWKNMLHNHYLNDTELKECDKYILTATTSLSNCALPYSFWLAGKFERPEWEVRIKTDSQLKIISQKSLD